VKKIFVFMLAFGGYLNLATAQSWPNEPVGSTVLADNPWNETLPTGWDQLWGCDCRIVSDPTAPLSPNNVLEARRLSGSTGGSDSAFQFSAKDDLYVGFYWKPSNPFTGWAQGQNKIALLQSPAGGHVYILMNGAQNSGSFSLGAQLDYGDVDNGHLPNSDGDSPGARNIYPGEGNSKVTLGEWHRVEIYMKKSTKPSDQNGVFQMWVNGSRIINHTKVNYPSGFTMVWMTQIWDSGIPLTGGAEYHWYDHTRISTGGTGGSNPSAPQVPRNLKVN
jgi:hypothetical protein